MAAPKPPASPGWGIALCWIAAVVIVIVALNAGKGN